jgi:nucleoside-diphosphate-sugar epimerase
MKIVVTGSLGKISKPLAILLLKQGHAVTVISSKAEKRPAIEAIGAQAAIGSLEDAGFLTSAFTGADALYAMIPFSFTEADQTAYMHRIANSYLQAIKQTGVKRVVVLSGWAADLIKGENVEGLFDSLTDTSVTVLRPASFYSNFYFSMDMIKGKGLIGKFLTLRYSGLWALLTGKTGLLMGNCGGEDRMVFVSPLDIADVAAEELVSISLQQKTIRYVGSEEMTCNEAAKIIGTAVGKPWLKWVLISDQQMLQGMKMAKMPDQLAELMVEMQAVNHSGAPLRNFHKHGTKMGKVKLKDFAKEFAAVYHQK